MRISFKREEILEGIQKIASILPQKSGAAFLRTVWIKSENNNLNFLATDSNIEIICNYPAQVYEPGLIGVQGKIFADLIKKMNPGEIIIELKEQKIIIKQGKNKYTIPVVESSWFQELQNFPEENKQIWSGDIFKEIIDRVYFCICDDETMGAMTCLSIKKGQQFGEVEFCGLNGPKLAVFQLDNDDIYNTIPDSGILIHKKIVNELKKILPENEIELNITPDKLFIRTIDKKEMYSFPLSSYEFPKYNEFVDKYQNKLNSILTIDRKLLIDSLDRLLLFNTSSKSTIFQISENNLILKAYGSELGEAEEVLPCTYNGKLENITLLTKDAIEILDHFNSNLVKFCFSDNSSEPFKVEGEDEFKYFIFAMPVEIREENYYSEE
ncbi:MAG: DNA polymerase III subunit beta [Desulfonauticus sp.]|nr:DNA polymerase III subunit beta [Desulfonauticus sp.]